MYFKDLFENYMKDLLICTHLLMFNLLLTFRNVCSSGKVNLLIIPKSEEMISLFIADSLPCKSILLECLLVNSRSKKAVDIYTFHEYLFSNATRMLYFSVSVYLDCYM